MANLRRATGEGGPRSSSRTRGRAGVRGDLLTRLLRSAASHLRGAVLPPQRLRRKRHPMLPQHRQQHLMRDPPREPGTPVLPGVASRAAGLNRQQGPRKPWDPGRPPGTMITPITSTAPAPLGGLPRPNTAAEQHPDVKIRWRTCADGV